LVFNEAKQWGKSYAIVLKEKTYRKRVRGGSNSKRIAESSRKQNLGEKNFGEVVCGNREQRHGGQRENGRFCEKKKVRFLKGKKKIQNG